MVNSRTDYPAIAVEAARSVMLELVRLLGEYRDDAVIIGGWVPELLLSGAQPKHIGSIDVDLALNHRRITEAGYRTILEHLTQRGYKPGDNPHVFYRDVIVEGQEVKVEVDLLAGEYGGTGKSRRHQRIQDITPRKARGCDLAFEMNSEVQLEGTLPDGGEDCAKVRVAGIVPFIIMKGMALSDRMKAKDAWDIWFCLKNYPGGLGALVDAFRPHIKNKLVAEGLRKIREKFTSPNHVGPKWVADFDEIDDQETRELRIRDAYERVQDLLVRLGISSS
jgi:hypothetical protein